MEYIIEQILKILNENNISMYSLAKSTGISRSNLHMMLHCKRKLQSKYFYSIVDNLPLSLEKKNILIDRFQSINLGDTRYNANKDIMMMLKNLSDYTYYKANLKFKKPDFSPIKLTRNNALFRGIAIQSMISQLFIEEMSCGEGKAYVYIPGISENINSYIDSVLQQYDTDISIIFMIDFLNNGSNENQNYNLKVLRNILPVMLSNPGNYSFFYTYTNSIITSDYMTPFPYFIALTKKVIWINSDFSEIMVTNDKELTKNIINTCQGKLKHYKTLANINSSEEEILSFVINGPMDEFSHYCIEYDPCLSMFFNKELVDAVLSDDVPMREHLLSGLYKRLEQLQNLKNTIQIFNKDSLMEFARTGLIKEYPDGYQRPLTKKERVFILNELLKASESEKHIFRAINPVNLNISDCLSLIVIDENTIQFNVWNDKKIPLRYITINEQSICQYFVEFITDLINTNYLYSKEETISFIRDAIDYLK